MTLKGPLTGLRQNTINRQIKSYNTCPAKYKQADRNSQQIEITELSGSSKFLLGIYLREGLTPTTSCGLTIITIQHSAPLHYSIKILITLQEG
jgi:hypothetical protein